jgi:hypothetical protein
MTDDYLLLIVQFVGLNIVHLVSNQWYSSTVTCKLFLLEVEVKNINFCNCNLTF